MTPPTHDSQKVFPFSERNKLFGTLAGFVLNELVLYLCVLKGGGNLNKDNLELYFLGGRTFINYQLV